MIPLVRRSSKVPLETPWLPYSRQSLPRPARYSTASKRASAPALALATPPLPNTYIHFTPPSPLQNADSGDVGAFLRRRIPYTLLPTPLPEDSSSELHDFFFTDSPTQDLLAVMGACLHNCHDVNRAKYVFETLRDTRPGDPILNSRLYNAFLETYLKMASDRDKERRDMWMDEAWSLFEIMETGREKVFPTAGTYATMLVTWLRFNPDAPTTHSRAGQHNPMELLQCILDREIGLSQIISDKVMASSEEATQIIEHLTRAAIELGVHKVLNELGQVEVVAADPLENVPEVRPVMKLKGPQVSNGEDDSEISYKHEVPFNLHNLRTHLAEVAFARRVLVDDAASRQKMLESSVYDVAMERLKRDTEKMEELGITTKHLHDKRLQQWMYEWHEKLKVRLEAEIKNIHEQEASLPLTGPRMGKLGPFLSTLKPEKLSLITILELMRLQGTGGIVEGMKTARAILSVGKAVEIEHKAEILKKHHVAVPASPARGNEGSYFTKKAYEHLKTWRMNAQNYMEEATDWNTEWTQLVRARLGSFLVECLMDVAMVTRGAEDKRTGEMVEEEQPAFYHSYEYVHGHKLGVVRLNPVVSEQITKDGLRMTLHPRHLPMLVPPKPWLTHNDGGYLFNKTTAMRFKDTQEQAVYLQHAATHGHVELVFASLDVLGNVPWVINRPIFDIVLQAWNSGEGVCKIPPATFSLPEPVKPDNYDTDQATRTSFIYFLRAYQHEKANHHSDRCNVNYKIEIARAYVGDRMYMPHNVDFRGRAYPIPPHLSHIGDDLSRGLLTFADKKRLGKSGLRWIKIHLANLYGYDKGNFEERVRFVDDHLKEIYDSAEKPLEGGRWWTNADDPWQCLACCMELRNALESGDPEGFESSLPVHQDGTCNGLQHYAALGGDIQGAKQVNLDVTDRPSDVYTYVAEMVEKMIADDAAKGEKYAQILLGKISRKVVKQTVMTTVYGVTFIGARLQIEKQLKERKDIPEDSVWLASSYLARKTMLAIGDLFTGAKDIQNWLTLSARLIAKAIPGDRIAEAMDVTDQENLEGIQLYKAKAGRLAKEQMTSVVWTTPLGLPIVQPYRKVRRRQIMTSLQSVYISDPNMPSQVNTSKQASAFPPNFIHSLDATHMMMTALECRTQGLTFAAVHDSYWTHACDIDKMSGIIRDTFIALHESNVLERLHKEFLERYAGYKVPVIALRGMHKKMKLPSAAVTLIADTPELAQKLQDELPGEDVDLGDPSGSGSAIGLGAEGEGEAEVDAKAEAEVEDEPETSVTKVKKTPKKRQGRPPADPRLSANSINVKIQPGSMNLFSRFVDLTALLPPLPEKGDFDVKTIKKSQYFFS